jgi:hypothetical protein
MDSREGATKPLVDAAHSRREAGWGTADIGAGEEGVVGESEGGQRDDEEVIPCNVV